MDMIDIEILEDGTVSVKTESISQANHVSADDLMLEIETLTGGSRTTEKREHPFWKKRKVLRGGKIVRIRNA